MICKTRNKKKAEGNLLLLLLLPSAPGSSPTTTLSVLAAARPYTAAFSGLYSQSVHLHRQVRRPQRLQELVFLKPPVVDGPWRPRRLQIR
ncbi:hypothetical protein VTK73DRAFT_5305 [Phialemonium thermophilum]|uniref:Secreted protein n=1 Tax=Phialemonium thermophilum TaxID=223376 RepID=A0ABR3V2I5_9PEZI